MKYKPLKFVIEHTNAKCPQCELPYYLMSGLQRPYRDKGVCRKCGKRIEEKKVNSSYPW